MKELKRQGRLEELEKLLMELIDAVEAEARRNNWGVASWYYEEAAKLYRKQKDFAREVAILERFAGQEHGQGARNRALAERLEKAKALLEKHKEKPEQQS